MAPSLALTPSGALLYVLLEVERDLGAYGYHEDRTFTFEVRGRLSLVDGEWFVAGLQAKDRLGRWCRADYVLMRSEVVEAESALIERGEPMKTEAKVLRFRRWRDEWTYARTVDRRRPLRQGARLPRGDRPRWHQ
jgi:hypothetical protein